MDKERATDFAKKAKKRLGWCDELLEEMRVHGRIAAVEKVERTFVSLLLLLDSVHQALGDCAGKLDEKTWVTDLNSARNADPLLRYLWKARNSEAHDTLIKWRPSVKHLEFQVVDTNKANAVVGGVQNQRASVVKLICFAYGADNELDLIEKMKTNPLPSEIAQGAAGIRLLQSLDSLSLKSFTIGRGGSAEVVQPPSSHGGAFLPPSADQAALFGIRFYYGKLGELLALL
jgi:hypothetical protein